MQKSANRCTSTGKVTKKTTKKMGTPSPPAKKKKTPETGAKQHEEATTSTATARSKSPAKKKANIVAKKAQAGRKDLKATATPKKKCPKKPAVKRAPAKKVVRAKTKTKAESKATDGDKVKRKTTTAKNKATNSKLKKEAALPISSEPPTVKKSGTVRATGLKSRAKGKVTTAARANKQKTMKKEAACKVVQAGLVVAEVSSQGDTTESTPSGDLGAQNKLERRDTMDSERKVSKKDDKKEEPTDKKQSEEINCKETIAKLLKKANKSITPKRKRDVMKIKSNTTMVKKAKVVRKPKKAQTHAVKMEPEEVKDQEAIDAKKVTKKPAKPKKKANVKEEKVEIMKEEIKEGTGGMDKQEDVAVDECVKKEEDELNTDDSTTSDEMTLSLLKHSTDQPTCSKMVDDKVSKGKKVAKVKSEPSSESDQKYKPPVKRKASPKVLQDKKKKMMMLKKAAAAAAKDKPRSDSDQKSRKLKLYSWWTGPKRHRVASLNALAKVHCLYENESRGALYDVIKRSPVAKESNSDDPEHEPSVEPTVEASTRTLRSVPGLRGVAGGGYWEMHDETSSSSSSVSSSEENSNDDSVDGQAKLLTPPPSYKQKQQEKKQAAAAAAVVAEDAAQVKEKPVKAPRKRRNRTELMMDLKDMVVRKRMASLNASAMLAASYSVEKKPLHCVQTSESSDTDDGSDASVMTDVLSSDREPSSKRQCYETDVNVKKEEKLIEVRASPNKKVAVIVNQDTDVTITGVYVNSTTRSTHHEGYCTVAGMQYRISATSHTQTAATAVATETLLHSEHGAAGDQSVPCKSYTPLGALSSMQPPGSHVPPPQPPPHSPTGRRHGCPSAFTAPPTYGPPPPHHHHHPPGAAGPEQPSVPPPPTYIHGYYQPAGPLITAHHGHTHPPPLPVPAGKVVAVAAASLEASPSPTPPPPPTLLPPTITTHQPPPSSTGTAESSDNEVIITSASSGGGTEPVPVALPLPAHTYRYTNSGQYPPPPPPPPGYTYSAAAVAAAAAAYPPSQYYHHAPPPPATYAQQQQQHFHHDICYPGTAGYAASYIHPKTYTTFRRYLPAPPPPAAAPQYYQTNAAELYPGPPPSNATSSQVVSAGPSGAGGGNSSSYQQQQPQQPPPPSATLVESYVPPPAPVPPTIVEPYPPPPPPHYYTGYSTGPAPPPACYTHSPPTRNLAFIDAAYQSCPCPMQSCPKNVHTGPLTGDGKRSSVIAKESSGVPLPPVALALPLEPASVAGPPSPARGSAGMPPPPSPAGATYQPTPITSNNNNNNSNSSSNNNSSSTIGVPPILTPKWEDDQVLLMEKPTSTECTTTATTQVLLTSSSSTSSSTSTTDKRNKMARVGKQMARNNIMLLMCHNTPANSGENPVKREVESPEEIKTLVQSIAVPSTPPPTPTPSPMLLVSETKRESPESITELAEKLLKAEQQPQEVKQSLKNETYYAEEVQCVPQMRVMRRHSTQQQRQQHQQCKVVNNTSRRKSLQTHDVPELKHEENVERAGVKRKLTDTTLITSTAGTNTDAAAAVDDECKTQSIKKQKPNTKSKSAVAAVNGSYKDLIKRDKCVKVADVKPPERKFLLYKTPKIMLGRAKKTAKRKTTIANKDEPVSKRLKTSSRPLVASNLHNSKQNKQPPVQSCANVLAEKKPCQKRAQVNSKVHRGSISNTNTTTTSSSSSSIVLTNVDRTIESVVTQCSTSSCDEHTTQVVLRTNNSAATGGGGSVVQARGVGSGRSGASKRKPKSSTIDTTVAADLVAAPAACIVPRVPRKSLHMPRWSNGWSWDGVPFQGKVFLNSDEALVMRRCYPAMRHTEGDIISPRDCVLLKAGPRKIDLPFVAKVAALWEDEDGEMMMSLLWYYRPEHTDQGRRPVDRPDEVFASRHKDTNSVACIEDKCYVLTFNEYCRYRKSVRRLEEGLEHTGQVVPMPEGGTYHRQHRQPPAPLHTAPELVFFCRQVYDFRQKRLMKNPS